MTETVGDQQTPQLCIPWLDPAKSWHLWPGGCSVPRGYAATSGPFLPTVGSPVLADTVFSKRTPFFFWAHHPLSLGRETHLSLTSDPSSLTFKCLAERPWLTLVAALQLPPQCTGWFSEDCHHSCACRLHPGKVPGTSHWITLSTPVIPQCLPCLLSHDALIPVIPRCSPCLLSHDALHAC